MSEVIRITEPDTTTDKFTAFLAHRRGFFFAELGLTAADVVAYNRSESPDYVIPYIICDGERTNFTRLYNEFERRHRDLSEERRRNTKLLAGKHPVARRNLCRQCEHACLAREDVVIGNRTHRYINVVEAFGLAKMKYDMSRPVEPAHRPGGRRRALLGRFATFVGA